MHQNLSLDRLLRQMRDNNLTTRHSVGDQITNIPRKLCISLENGNRMRFPYHFLMAEHYVGGDDEHLLLEFMSDTVKFKGINLPAVFDYLGQEPSHLYITPERYIPVVKNQPFIITDAVVDSPKNEA